MFKLIINTFVVVKIPGSLSPKTICVERLFMVRCMDNLRFKTLFNCISAISGRWEDENERLCAIEARLCLGRLSPRAGIEPGPLGQ